MAETAGSVQFGLTLGPLDGALQPSTEETLSEGKQMEENRVHGAKERGVQKMEEMGGDGSEGEERIEECVMVT